MSKKDEALRYARNGYSVIPLTENAKTPALSAWKDYQSKRMSLTDIGQFWASNPEYNVGIVTGSISGITVIDIDGDEGEQSYTNSGFEIPNTLTVNTPNGRHFYLKYDNRFSTGTSFLNKIDVRNDGGYVVAPPSVIDGNTYEIESDEYIEPVEWGVVPEQFQKRESASALDPSQFDPWVSNALLAGAPEGQRNEVATKLAGYFHSRGIPKDILKTIIHSFAEKCTPNIPPDEVETIVDSVLRYERNKDRAFADGVIPPPIVRVMPSNDIRVLWADSGVEAFIEQPSKDRERIKCRLTIKTKSNGYLYGPISFDLLSGTKRLEAERALKKRQDEDWGTILEYICRLSVSSLESSSDFVDMVTYQRPPSRRNTWLIDGFLARNKPTLIYADGGTGKSMFTVALAMSVASGINIIPELEVNESTGGSVIYLDWEAELEDHDDRTQWICNGLDSNKWSVNDFNIHYIRCRTSIFQMQVQIQKQIEETGAQLLVIDSLVPAVDSDANDADTARRFYQVLRSLDIPSLIISHTTKNPGDVDSKAKPFGSAYWWNQARSVWEIRKEQSAGDNYTDLAIINRKSNNWSIVEPIGVRMITEDMQSSEPKVTFEPITLATQNNSLSKVVPIKARIMSLLNGTIEGMSVKDIADELEENMDSVRQSLRRGLGSAFIQSVDQTNNSKVWKLK